MCFELTYEVEVDGEPQLLEDFSHFQLGMRAGKL